MKEGAVTQPSLTAYSARAVALNLYLKICEAKPADYESHTVLECRCISINCAQNNSHAVVGLLTAVHS